MGLLKLFIRHQVPLDDTAETDALVYFPACIEWIDSEITKGRGVLVHCQVGMNSGNYLIALANVTYRQE